MEWQIPVCLAAGWRSVKNRGGPIWEDMTVTNRWLKWDLKWVQSIGRQHQPSVAALQTMPWYFAGHVALLFQTRLHAPSVSGFQGNCRPPACWAELCSLVKAGQTSLLSCLWVTMDPHQPDSTVSPAILLQFQALPLITLHGWCLATWLHCPALKGEEAICADTVTLKYT